jgi:arylsulfatase A-like enzyme
LSVTPVTDGYWPDNFQWLNSDTPTLARRLREAGVKTAAIGKMHFYPWDNPEHFEYRIIAEDKRHIYLPDHYTQFLERNGYKREHPAINKEYRDNLGSMLSPLPEECHIDSFIGAEAVKWIRSMDKDQPFFGWISFNSPHDPYDPPSRFAELYQNIPVPKPAGSFNDFTNKPSYQNKIIPFFRDNLLYLSDYSKMSPEIIEKMRRYYYATITLVDEWIGKILIALEEKCLLDSTYIVFSSDHGDTLGDHGLPFKSTFYEGALKVPLIITGPGVAKGKRCASFTDWLDLHKTFLALNDIKAEGFEQGEDILPLLEQPAKIIKDVAFSELSNCAMAMDKRHKLVLCSGGDGELYDLEEKPQETINHFNDPAFSEIRGRLTQKLVQHFISNSRVQRFGGGTHKSEDVRKGAFENIRQRIKNGDFTVDQ